MGNVALRRATPVDSAFCFRSAKAATGDYVAAIWGWNKRLQRYYHDQGYVPDRWQIITADGVDVGVLKVDYPPVRDLLGTHRAGPGPPRPRHGSQVIRGLFDRAAVLGHPVVLDVLHVNKRAPRVYQRPGFVQTCHHGPTTSGSG